MACSDRNCARIRYVEEVVWSRTQPLWLSGVPGWRYLSSFFWLSVNLAPSCLRKWAL